MSNSFKKHALTGALFLILVLSLVAKSPSLHTPHTEGDERIYLTLAANFMATGDYTLQGTPILPKLSSSVYDKPFFHHPPMFIFLLVSVMENFGAEFAVLVSWFAHLLIITFVFLFLRQITGGNFLATTLPTLACSLDPILVFTSQKIWIDLLMAAFCTVSFYYFTKALKEPRRLLFGLSGAFLGVATITKLPALLIAPVLLGLYLYQHRKRERSLPTYLGDLLAFAGPAVLISLPWFAAFYSHYGLFVPTWTRPDAQMLEHYPYVKMVASRPWYYFFMELTLLNPVVLMLGVLCVVKRATLGFEEKSALVYFFAILLAFTALGMNGHTYQMRFLTLLVPAIYLLWGALLREHTRILVALSVLFMLPNAYTSAYYTFNYRFPDIFSVWELLGLL